MGVASENIMVSVCLQVYQHKEHIEQCLDSVLMQQTNFLFEIIIGEDESADGSREICEHYAEKYPDIIKLFLRDRKDVIYINDRPTGRFNFLENLKQCSGKYIAMLEGDDFWTDAYKLQKQVDVLEMNSKLVGCFHNSEERFYQDYSRASTLYVPYKSGKELTHLDYTSHNLSPTASVMFKNDLPPELFSETFKKLPVGDWPLHLLHTRKGNYYYIPQVMSVRNMSTQSSWGMKDQRKNTEKMIGIYNTLIASNWFDKESVHSLSLAKERMVLTLLDFGAGKKTSFKEKVKHNLINRIKKF